MAILSADAILPVGAYLAAETVLPADPPAAVAADTAHLSGKIPYHYVTTTGWSFYSQGIRAPALPRPPLCHATMITSVTAPAIATLRYTTLPTCRLPPIIILASHFIVDSNSVAAPAFVLAPAFALTPNFHFARSFVPATQGSGSTIVST